MKWLIPLLLVLVCLDVRAQEPTERYVCRDHKKNDVISLACNIYWEARNQSFEGMLGVAAVTLWRADDDDYPDSISKVVWQKSQFSWTIGDLRRRPLKSEQDKWEQAWAIAKMLTISPKHKTELCPQIATTRKMWKILKKRGVRVKQRPIKCEAYDEAVEERYELMEAIDPTDGALMFHAVYAKPGWRKRYQRTVRIETHIFYRRKGA